MIPAPPAAEPSESTTPTRQANSTPLPATFGGASGLTFEYPGLGSRPPHGPTTDQSLAAREAAGDRRSVQVPRAVVLGRRDETDQGRERHRRCPRQLPRPGPRRR